MQSQLAHWYSTTMTYCYYLVLLLLLLLPCLIVILHIYSRCIIYSMITNAIKALYPGWPLTGSDWRLQLNVDPCFFCNPKMMCFFNCLSLYLQPGVWIRMNIRKIHFESLWWVVVSICYGVHPCKILLVDWYFSDGLKLSTTLSCRIMEVVRPMSGPIFHHFPLPWFWEEE